MGCGDLSTQNKTWRMYDQMAISILAIGSVGCAPKATTIAGADAFECGIVADHGLDVW
jgi:hypothetical protein